MTMTEWKVEEINCSITRMAALQQDSPSTTLPLIEKDRLRPVFNTLFKLILPGAVF